MIAEKAINTHEKVRDFQNRLYLTAKADRKRKFYALYDKIYRKDILEEAWKRVKQNGGAGGIDKVSIDDVKAYGEEKLLDEIAEDLRAEKYRCKPVRRTYIPKQDGRKRALGIPTIKDRIVQMAAKIVIEPVFEADFQPCSYGFRPKRNAKQAMDRIYEMADKGGALWVIDADIRDYFGSINHDKLLLLVKQRITDRRVLKLIKGWLKAGVLEDGQYSESTVGAPQGGVISPLLSNIYLNYFDVCWSKRFGHLGELVRYADDFVILCKKLSQAEEALRAVKWIMKKLELTLHSEKTRLVDMYFGKDSFDFLGFNNRFQRFRNKSWQWYWTLQQIPSKKAMKKMRANIKEVFASPSKLLLSMEEMVKLLNPKIIGMRNYYARRFARLWLWKIDKYINFKFTRWYNRKKQRNYRLGNAAKVRELTKQAGLASMCG
ncbi:group II intron reverse transcriptase/maturase [Acetivibrio clariflavus]|uniref:RNA-directed DNA polymerase n=1 Tax=Acetivibrio clariflavus (strain DSM 19732 / NBRC 101661 / EBR45) TaxID=720554 RepID=G8LZC3_ACECE|nr:group II intron reverse transcriptase/maturase [Acetivibrio clariflavus]AEV70085.1 Retron-type reverse transcriptase [Acetivibrio clariflavus DSM 19732]